MYLIAPHQKQYKANLHCHSVFSDGKKTPEELKEMYQRHGYSILAITDHETPKNHSHLSEKDFLMLTGYEAYIRPNEQCAFDVYDREIHMNLFAKTPENETIICYNPKYCKYIPKEEQAGYKKAGSQKAREYSVAYINEFIQTARENGYLVAYNHPWWSFEDEADIFAYDGFFSMEMCNYGAYLLSRLEYNGALYDKLLKRKKRIFCHSADDNHNADPEGSPKCDSFGAFTMILAEELEYGAVISAMERGKMYSSMGPIFNEISVDGNKVHIECSEVSKIMMYTGSKSPCRKFAEPGNTITSADFEIDARAEYIRISVVDQFGNFADTRGYFIDELCD